MPRETGCGRRGVRARFRRSSPLAVQRFGIGQVQVFGGTKGAVAFYWKRQRRHRLRRAGQAVPAACVRGYIFVRSVRARFRRLSPWAVRSFGIGQVQVFGGTKGAVAYCRKRQRRRRLRRAGQAVSAACVRECIFVRIVLCVIDEGAYVASPRGNSGTRRRARGCWV